MIVRANETQSSAIFTHMPGGVKFEKRPVQAGRRTADTRGLDFQGRRVGQNVGADGHHTRLAPCYGAVFTRYGLECLATGRRTAPGQAIC